MEQLIERFKLISAAINLHEESIVKSQIKKIKNFSLNSQARDIVSTLENGSYDEALFKIRNYIKNLADMSAYKDPKIQQLQVQLRTLEMDLGNLYGKKHEHLGNIYEFTTLYHYYLDKILNKILKHRLQNADKMFKNGSLDKNIYEKIKNQYKTYQDSMITHTQAIPFELSNEDKAELKQLYKQASQTINPDILTEDYKKRTQKMFNALNTAYKKRDLATVKKIQKAIEDNPKSVYGFQKIDNIDALREQSKNLRLKIESLNKDIQTIQKSKIFIFLQNTKDLKGYFQQLQNTLTKLEKELIVKID